MTTTTTAGTGANPARAPWRDPDEVPRGALLGLLGAWTVLIEGAIGLVMLPVLVFTTEIDIPPGDIAAFAGVSLGCLGGGIALYTTRTWSWWVAIATSVVAASWLVADRGLVSWAEVYVACGLAVVVTVLLTVGRSVAGHPNTMALVSAKIPFRAKVALVWIGIFLVIGTFLGLSDLDTGWIGDNFEFIVFGLTFTLLLALGAILLAVTLALLGALGRLSHNPVAYGVSGFYTSFFRGTPLIVQLFLIYSALPQIGGNLERLSLVNVLTLTAFQAGIIGLGLNYGAYMTEIFRAGIQSVSHGQGEAADALGMSSGQRLRRVVLPQATRVIIPPTGNEFIALMKDTALVSVLGAEVARAEVFRRASQAGGQDLRRLEAYIIAAATYWALTALFTAFQSRLERRMSTGYVRTVAGSARGSRPKLLSLGTSQPGILVEAPDAEPPRPRGTSASA